MNPSQFLGDFSLRNIPRLDVACVTAAFLLVVVSAILLGIFEASAWGMKVLLRALGVGNAPVRRLPILKI